MVYQACRNLVMSMFKGKFQRGPALVVFGVYGRAMLEQQARAFDRPAARKTILLPP